MHSHSGGELKGGNTEELSVLVDLEQEVVDINCRVKRKKENKLHGEVFGGFAELDWKSLPDMWLELAKTSTKQHQLVIQK